MANNGEEQYKKYLEISKRDPAEVLNWERANLSKALNTRGIEGEDAEDALKYWASLPRVNTQDPHTSGDQRAVGLNAPKVPRGDPPPGEQWFWKDPNAVFSDHIPFNAYRDHARALCKLKNYFSEESTYENQSITIFDVPGAGKSSTVWLAALETKSVYTRVRPDQGVLKTATKLMQDEVNKISSPIKASELLSKLAPFCYGALGSIFTQCSGKLETQGLNFGNLSTNGMESLTGDQCRERLQTLLEKIADKNKDTAFVLHIDEAHNWPVPFAFKRKHDEELVDGSDCQHYILIAFSEALEALRGGYASLRICITGTNVFMDRSMRFASNFKVRALSLGLISASVTRDILSVFLSLDFLSEQQQSTIAEEIGYNGRSIQYFLQELVAKFPPATTMIGDVTYEDLQECMTTAYDEWLAIILSHKVMQDSTQEETYTTLGQLLLLFAYPTAMGVEEQPDGAVRFSPVESFPSKWRDFAAAGAFRVVSPHNAYIDLHKPKGFLLRWVTGAFTKKIHPQTLVYFTAYAICAASDQIGGPGHLFEKAIAAELTMLASPLYQTITKAIGGNLRPDESVLMKPVALKPRLQDYAGNLDTVFCVCDTNKRRDRVVDVAFPLMGPNESKIDVWCDLKTEATETELWRMVGDFFFNKSIPEGPRIFISLYPFQHKLPRQYTKKETKDKNAAEEGEEGDKHEKKKRKQVKGEYTENKKQKMAQVGKEKANYKEEGKKEKNTKESSHDIYNKIQGLLYTTDLQRLRKYIILDGDELFQECLLPISPIFKDLQPEDFEMFHAERKAPFIYILERLVPQILRALS